MTSWLLLLPSRLLMLLRPSISRSSLFGRSKTPFLRRCGADVRAPDSTDTLLLFTAFTLGWKKSTFRR